MRDDDSGGGLMSVGQAIALLLLAPLVFMWALSEMGLDPVAAIASFAGGL